ncbi:MAG: DUF1684 domain-containing protein [Promethearchaeota archaeon]
MVDQSYKESVLTSRQEKDRFFQSSGHSPIPSDEREKFAGLKYFPINPDYRYELEIKIHPKAESFDSSDSGGNVRKFYRYGEFHFIIGGESYILQAYKSSLKETGLFVPFKDSSNGDETYGAGRYLDLDEDWDKTPDGKYILDFNFAYSPYCAYNHGYACALTPFENHLQVTIPAGEKSYH